MRALLAIFIMFNCSQTKFVAIILVLSLFFDSREAIAAIIEDIVVCYNSKNLNCIGALFF